MKHLPIIAALALMSCSTSIDGLWIERDNEALLKFYGDSVISNTPVGDLRLGFEINHDSIKWKGLNPEFNYGYTERSFKYKLEKDTLTIWYGKGNYPTRYYKSRANTYHDHILTVDGIKIDLPIAENTRPLPGGHNMLDIKIGLKNQKVKVYIQNNETEVSEIANQIDIITKRDTSEFLNHETICRMFIDRSVPSDFTLNLLDHLKNSDIRTVYFMSKSKSSDAYNDNFEGLRYYMPDNKMRLEDKNAR